MASPMWPQTVPQETEKPGQMCHREAEPDSQDSCKHLGKMRN
jgi:hypothetical protein